MFKFWPWFEANRKRLIGVGVVALAILFVWYYITSSRQQKEIAAGQAYTQFQLNQPPTSSAQQVADGYLHLAKEYAGTVAAQRAQLEAAAILFNADRYADAQKQFQSFLAGTAGGSLAATAKLGVAACQEAQGQLDAALSSYREVTTGYRDTTDAMAAKFSMGRILELQGKLADAVTSYKEVAQSQLAGSLASEAANRIALIQVKLAAQKPATSVTPATKS